MQSGIFRIQTISFAVLIVAATLQAQDLKITKKLSVGNTDFNSETYVKGTRERDVMALPGGAENVSIRQCDLNRTLTLNPQTQAYLAIPDPQSDDANDAAALLTGAPAAAQSGGKIVMTSTVTDTGERKQMLGYQARHVKTNFSAESSPGACSKIHQKFSIDGWYADIGKDTKVSAAGCTRAVPPVRQTEGCHDAVVLRGKPLARPGLPLTETINIETEGAQPVTMNSTVTAISRQPLAPDLFDAPAGFHQVNSALELYAPQVAAATSAAGQAPYGVSPAANPMALLNPAAARSPMMGMGAQGGAPAGGMQVAAPQPLGPKAAGKIRIGILAPDAQIGQGSNSGTDYATPIRNVMVQYMNGPAVEVVGLDSRVPMQVQAEAQQKQCDYVLLSTVNVKHGGSGGFGKFMSMAGPASSMVPMLSMAKGVGAAAAMASMATTAATQSAAMMSLNSFNQQIKTKDEVTMAYRLVPTGQDTPKVSNTVKANATADGQDVLTPLIQQMATSVLTEAAKK